MLLTVTEYMQTARKDCASESGYTITIIHHIINGNEMDPINSVHFGPVSAKTCT